MKDVLHTLRPIAQELLFMLLFILVLAKGIGLNDKVIRGDGVGYYEYLPSLFIHHDLNRKNADPGSDANELERIGKYGFYVEADEHKVNKYPCGTAVLELPFFLTAYSIADLEGTSKDGYQKPFHRAVRYSAFFYLFLALLFLKKLLRGFQLDEWTIGLLQGLLLFGTGVTHYASFDASYSHVFSLFGVTGFFAYTRSFFRYQDLRSFYIASLLFGLVLLIRQANGLVLFFVPFLAASPTALKQGVSKVLQNPSRILSGILVVLALLSIQSVVWHLQTGSFILYSYQGEGFDFTDPRIMDVLFSYRTGLFTYTPLLLLAPGAIIWLFYKRDLYLSLTWLFYFFLITYFLASWWAWHFGCSFGHRAYVDHYAVFLLPVGLLLNKASFPIRGIFIFLALITVPVNLIQTYQYKSSILHWCEMDRTKYWKTFLRTEEVFKGMVWKTDLDPSEHAAIRSFTLENVKLPPDREPKVLWSIKAAQIPDLNEVQAIRVEVKDEYAPNERVRLGIRITGKGSDRSYLYRHDPFLLHFSHGPLGTAQTGSEVFKFDLNKADEPEMIELFAKGDGEHHTLEKLKISFFKQKKEGR